MKMLAVLKEISGYSFFLSIVFLVAYGNRPPAAFLVQNALKTQFIDSVCAWVSGKEEGTGMVGRDMEGLEGKKMMNKFRKGTTMRPV